MQQKQLNPGNTPGPLCHAEHTENKPDDTKSALSKTQRAFQGAIAFLAFLQVAFREKAMEIWANISPTGLSLGKIKDLLLGVVAEAKDPKRISGFCTPELRKQLLSLCKTTKDETTKDDDHLSKLEENGQIASPPQFYTDTPALHKKHPPLCKNDKTAKENDRLPKRQESRMIVLYTEFSAHLRQVRPDLAKLLELLILVRYEECVLPINRCAKYKVKSPSDAEDIAQSVLMLLNWEVCREALGLVTHENLESYLTGKVHLLAGEQNRKKTGVPSDPQSVEDNDNDAPEALSEAGIFSPLDIPLLEQRIEKNIQSAKSLSTKSRGERRCKLFDILKKHAHLNGDMPNKAQLAEEMRVSIDTIDSDLKQIAKLAKEIGLSIKKNKEMGVSIDTIDSDLIAELAKEMGVSIDTIDSNCEPTATQHSDAELPACTTTVTQNGDTQ